MLNVNSTLSKLKLEKKEIQKILQKWFERKEEEVALLVAYSGIKMAILV